jgi:hypothetical protein
VAGRSGDVNGWGLLDARKEREAAHAPNQVLCALSRENLTDLRLKVKELGLAGKRIRGLGQG